MRENKRFLDRVRRQPVQDFIRSKKEGKACTDCKAVWPWYVLEFDHTGEQGKSHTVSMMVHKYWREKDWHIIEAEIAKCEIVCRNCHVIRTHTRGQWGKPQNNDHLDPSIVYGEAPEEITSRQAAEQMSLFDF